MYSRIVSQNTIDNAKGVAWQWNLDGDRDGCAAVLKLADEANAAERANEALVMQLHRLEDELDKEREKRNEIVRMMRAKAKTRKTTRGARGQRG